MTLFWTIVIWIVFGAIIGWLASIVMGRNRSMGFFGNVLVGIVGSALGGWLYHLISGKSIATFNIWRVLVAIGGACVLLLVLGLFRRRGK